VGYIRCILNSILLREESAKATTADDNLVSVASKMLSDALNVVHELVERVRFRARTLPMASVIKRENSPFVTQRTICLEV